MLRKLIFVLGLLCIVAWLGYRIHQRQITHLLQSEEFTGLRGAYHVHSVQSHDSQLTLDQIAQAAADLGLDFVVLSDHNQQSAGAVVRHGVLLLSYAELSTPFGHLVQFGARDMVSKEDRGSAEIHAHVATLGGDSILAHPADRKREWNGPVQGAGGVEIANIASAARRRGGPLFLGLLPALLAWKGRPELALVQLYDRDIRALRLWDGELNPGFVGLCAVDAHGRIPLRENLDLWTVVLPELSRADMAMGGDTLGARRALEGRAENPATISHERTGHENESTLGKEETALDALAAAAEISVSVGPAPSPQTAAEAIASAEASAHALEMRAERLTKEIAAGRFYCAAGLLAKRPRFDFYGVADNTQATRLVVGSTESALNVAELVVKVPLSDGVVPTIVMLRNGEEVLRSQGQTLRYAEPSVGVYRVEVRLAIPEVVFGHRSVPVIYSGRLRVGNVEPTGEEPGEQEGEVMTGVTDLVPAPERVVDPVPGRLGVKKADPGPNTPPAAKVVPDPSSEALKAGP